MSTSVEESGDPESPPEHHQRPTGRLPLALGALALLLAAVIWFVTSGEEPRRFTLATGYEGTARAWLSRTLADDLRAAGVASHVVDVGGSGSELAAVDERKADGALVSGAFTIRGHPRLREVAMLQIEALHLLVRRDRLGSVDPNLAALRGHSVVLGPRDSAEAALASAVLEFAQLPIGGEDGVDARYLDAQDLERLVAAGDDAALPDAVFHLGVVPARVVVPLVRDAGYTLVSLPYADSFRLARMLVEPGDAGAEELSRAHIVDTVVPAAAYQLSPAVPQAELHTIGTRLVLVAHHSVSRGTIEAVLGTIFEGDFARLAHPPLRESILRLAPRLPLHPGTEVYRRRHHPILTSDDVDTLSNTLSLIGALAGGALFAWQGFRQRRQARSGRLLEDYLRRVAEHERRVVELELAASLELEPLVELQRGLLALQGEALSRFAEGDFGDQATLADLLLPVNASRDHVGDLLLHVRSAIEEKAGAEGRAASALWDAAVEASEGAPDASPRETDETPG